MNDADAINIREIPKTYRGLLAFHVLRPIRGEAGLAKATAIIDAMAGHRLTRDQADYLLALSTLVEAYEAEHHAIGDSGASGIDCLRMLLDEHEMTATDFAHLLGLHRSMGSKILSGERALTAAHIAVLADHFDVRADVFVDRPHGGRRESAA